MKSEHALRICLFLTLGVAQAVLLGAEPKEASKPAPAKLGQFDDHCDVGQVNHAGAVEFNAERGEYRVTGCGGDIWGKADAFHFVWKKVAGDLTLGGNVRFEGDGKVKHRKACFIIREGLEPDAAYIDVAVHGDGLISLQYRKERGGVTAEVKSEQKGPVAVRLTRTGDKFTMALSPAGGAFKDAGSVTVELKGPLYAGLAVSSHDVEVSETAIFSDVILEQLKP